MSKAMVIINMPICCGECRVFQNNGNDCWCSITREDTTSLAMPESCPLKPLPERKDDYEIMDSWELEGILNAEVRGYNKCLEDLLGDEE